jgi:hypothetical protein
MLSWIFGAESSFSKALVYNLLSCSALLLFGAFAYTILVGFPSVLAMIANRK